jgi:hypothetical protein
LRASLAFATSLLALLLTEGHQAHATPTGTAGGADDAICACFQTADVSVVAAPAYVSNPYSSLVVLPTSTVGEATFAPVTTGSSTPATQTSPFETISRISPDVVVAHAKPGMLAAFGSGWSNSGGTSVYVGTSPNMALRDGSSGGSVSPVYGMTPTTVSASRTIGDSALAITNAAYIPNTGGAPPITFAATGANKVSKSVAAGPVYASSIVGSGVSNTPAPGQQPLVDFGTMTVGQSSTLDLAVQNLATGTGSSSDLTIEGYSITGADPGSFSADITPGTVIPAGGTLLVPLTVVGTGPGDLTSDLTIFTNEGAANGGTGEAFSYLLDPMVVSSQSTTAPEPASLAVLGVGLAALVGVRRRRSR